MKAYRSPELIRAITNSERMVYDAKSGLHRTPRSAPLREVSVRSGRGSGLGIRRHVSARPYGRRRRKRGGPAVSGYSGWPEQRPDIQIEETMII